MSKKVEFELEGATGPQDFSACPFPGCPGIGEHICITEMLFAMTQDEELLDIMWDTFMLYISNAGEEQ
jgi:hypothetical protein